MRMRIMITAFLPVAGALLIGDAGRAQDPYGNSYANTVEAHNQQQVTAFLNDVIAYYFAAGCKVFQSLTSDPAPARRRRGRARADQA
jgi:hypothetical protein